MAIWKNRVMQTTLTTNQMQVQKEDLTINFNYQLTNNSNNLIY